MMNSENPTSFQLELRRVFVDRLRYARAKNPSTATNFDRFVALSLATRDLMVERWIETQRTYYERNVKRAYYLSAEYLLGRSLRANLTALGVFDDFQRMLGEIGVDLDEVLEQEPDAGLGNGGLGRLAACFLESLATLSFPAMGYGIRYEFGIFEQVFRNGYQVERADEWLKFGHPWEFARPEYTVQVGFGGQTIQVPEERGFKVVWKPATKVIAVPYDTPVAGFGSRTVNTLRLWAARADQEFDFSLFNAGDYLRAVEEKNASEVISKVLYPNDSFEQGRELRLKQEYFFVACSIHDIVWRYLKQHNSFEDFSDKVAIQLNDTHPAIAIAELMRVLVDDHNVEWAEAWRVTTESFGYTNHTLLPEALERWPAALFARLLPRHLEIIQEINRRFLREVMAHWPHSSAHVSRMSILTDGAEKEVRMAHLAVVGSHSINGVAKLHTDLIKTQLLKDFNELYPERFNNKTNGVTPRRWLFECNPSLAALITERIGSEAWVTNLERLSELEAAAEDPDFRTRLRTIKMENKIQLSKLVHTLTKLRVDPQSIFDVQIKRLHEYKRQHLAALHAITLYLRARRGENIHPRTIIFGAKAAPGYRRAKLVIKLIHSIADLINGDKRQSSVRIAFLPNYRVSLAERIIPAADLSEQISTAGMEASGTGNMKLAMNGALTIGTLDGANIEIRDAVGAENFYLFGMTAEEVLEKRRDRFEGKRALTGQPLLEEALNLVREGFFCPEEKDIFVPLVEDLMNHDPYMVLADFGSYAATQATVNQDFFHADAWSMRTALNIARMGQFSSDRTIRDYASEIWGISPVRINEPRDPSLIPEGHPDPV
ncbi:MAG: glycogen/starch/alpha-glucan phosphorylase [Polyangiaceae bacterium]